MVQKSKQSLDTSEQEAKETAPASKPDDFIPSDLLRDIKQRLGKRHKPIKPKG
ncbi:hypothetical protein [Hafnia alvei]|uniref:hypothetical protein n=1 Tax=Hafnia alvei TaxID=569 RepID=UPI0021617B80|nr:hypothetical protein [Hafnia alvei]